MDLIHGLDILDDETFHNLLQLCESGLVGAAVAAPYCCKHSMATLRRPGPLPVRTPKFLDGLPSNSLTQQLAVRTAADRKVAAEYIEKQKKRVTIAMDDLIKLKRHSQIKDIVVFGCGDSGSFGLPASYQIEMGKCFDYYLISNGIRCVSTDMPVLHGILYDRMHMEDILRNRQLMIRFLKSLIRAHLTVLDLDVVEEDLLGLAAGLSEDPEERIQEVYKYPNLAQFRYALSKTDEVKESLNAAELPSSLAQHVQNRDGMYRM